MTAFEYASGLISIVIGLAIARVLGGVGAFLIAPRRSTSDWIVAGWYLALLLTMIGWWHAGWWAFRDSPAIDLGTSYGWSFATALFYLAAFVLVPDTVRHEPTSEDAGLNPLRPAFYLCLAAHFAAGTLVTTGPNAELSGLMTMSVMVLVSAAGAAARTDRARALHLFLWLAAVAVLSVKTPAIG